MVTFNLFQQIALSFPKTTVAAHFNKISFRVKGKIFATYDEKQQKASIKLAEVDQDAFIDHTAIYPVANKWGKQGWTIIDLEQVNEHIFKAALTKAYDEVGSK